jgi:hypothetical protein
MFLLQKTCQLRAKKKKRRVNGNKGTNEVIVDASMHHVLPYEERNLIFIHILV